jgi:plasmid stabilization system protein ParE
VTSASIIIAPEAQDQIEAVDAWWATHRPAAPRLFREELATALENLRALPLMGRAVRHREVKGLRRVVLRACRYHAYYVPLERAVFVLAVWSAVRGRRPSVRPPR